MIIFFIREKRMKISSIFCFIYFFTSIVIGYIFTMYILSLIFTEEELVNYRNKYKII